MSENARQNLRDAFHFILRVTNRGRDLSEDDFDKMADLFIDGLDAYVEARACSPRAITGETMSCVEDRGGDPAYVTVSMPGVLMVRETEISAKVLLSALHGMLERFGDRRVSIALTMVNPPTIDVMDDVALLRSAFGACDGERIEEAARRVVRDYVAGKLSTKRDFVVEAAMIVCRPGPYLNIEEACAVLRLGG
jgi:hypothetical protein